MSADTEVPINVELGRVGLLEQGYLVRSPILFEVAGHDFERACYITTKPLQIQGPDGFSHPLQVGDVLTAGECEHAGSALRAMVLRGELAELDVTRGLPRLWQLERQNAKRLEQELLAAGAT